MPVARVRLGSRPDRHRGGGPGHPADHVAFARDLRRRRFRLPNPSGPVGVAPGHRPPFAGHHRPQAAAAASQWNRRTSGRCPGRHDVPCGDRRHGQAVRAAALVGVQVWPVGASRHHPPRRVRLRVNPNRAWGPPGRERDRAVGRSLGAGCRMSEPDGLAVFPERVGWAWRRAFRRGNPRDPGLRGPT